MTRPPEMSPAEFVEHSIDQLERVGLAANPSPPMTQPDLARLEGLLERANRREPLEAPVTSDSRECPMASHNARVWGDHYRDVAQARAEIVALLPALLARIAALEECVRTIAEHKPISPALAHVVQMQRIARAALTLKENDCG